MYLTNEQESQTIPLIRNELQNLGIAPGIPFNKESLWIPLQLFWGLLFANPRIGQYEPEILNKCQGEYILEQLRYVTKDVRPMYMMREIRYIHVSVRSHAICLNLNNYKL
jgi:hypothetical protein